jgi:hypothetical protein
MTELISCVAVATTIGSILILGMQTPELQGSDSNVNVSCVAGIIYYICLAS